MATPIFDRRRFGVLLHPSSLPGGQGIGDLGEAARRFVDWLVEAGASVWQVLPVCPPGGPHGDVPYGSWSALAGNPQLISLDELVREGLLTPAELPAVGMSPGWAEPVAALEAKRPAFEIAGRRLRQGHPLGAELARFREEAHWAMETARFFARRAKTGLESWFEWPTDLASRDPAVMARVDRGLAEDIERALTALFLFEHQWAALRKYANGRGVALLGDVPIYVSGRGVDVWANQRAWQLGPDGRPAAFGGAPPDVFTGEGQVWAMPLYDWPAMADDGYRWWRGRFARALEHFDGIRLDHFLAFSSYWAIPPGASAREGRWEVGPGQALFRAVEAELGPLAACAEDLGHFDEKARALLDALGYPGMRVLHYGFGQGSDNLHLPHNIPERSVVYPGNHDNGTTLGWWRSLDGGARAHVQHYFGRHGDDIVWDINRAALASPARLAVIQMQDIVQLGTEARMNDPKSYAGPPQTWRNWRWRMLEHPSGEVATRLRFLAALYGRV